ncbi:hypothetical protein EAE96_011033 [Botrytis aclada]|nr:hypothetical protein EAE96_011033 [Botrytis aclada]
MHIWAGSGSTSGKETVRRRERTPVKTGTILRKRKSSARTGLGTDGSGSSEDIGKSSPGPSPRRDSGIDSVMASETDSDGSIITVVTIPTYDVEEDMVKPLNVGSLEGEGSLIGKIESGLKMLREERMKKNLHDEVEHSSTPSRVKGIGIESIDMDESLGEDTDDFSSSLRGLNRIMASNRRMFRASWEEEDRMEHSDSNVFAKKESVGTTHSIPTDLPSPLDTIGVPAEDTQAVWHEYAFAGSTNEPDSQTTAAASCINENSPESENELERLFRVDSVHTLEPPGISDDNLSHGISTPVNVKEFVFDSGNENENEKKLVCYSGVECVQDSETEKEDQFPDKKFTHEIDIDSILEEEKGPETPVKSSHEQLWDEISESFDKALDASPENRRKESIRGFSLKVPRFVQEAKQGLYRSPSPTRSRKSNEMVGEVSSLKETEFCASGLKDCGLGEGGLVTSIEGLGGERSAQMQREDDGAIASLEGVSSNFGSPISLSMMGGGGRDSARVGWENDEGGETREDSVERENERNIANSERFSPVHQRVIQLMTPKHGRYHTVREKGGKTPASYRMFESRMDEKSGSREVGSVVMERKASQYPAKERAFSQPFWSNNLNRYCSPASFGADNSKDSGANVSEEWFLEKERCSEIEEEMERFWKVNSEGPMARLRKTMEEMDPETEIEKEERKKLPVMGRKMKMKMVDLGSCEFATDENERGSMGSSQITFRDAPTIIRRSMPQLDGPSSPPLLAVESPVGSTRSPSPRKKLQKVNRSKSSSLMKASSSSLGKIFQNSRLDCMEGEIRDLRKEVEELKNMVGRLEREFERAVDSWGEDVGKMERRFEDKVKEVWSVIYGKDWEGEEIGEGGGGWINLEDVEWMREVRDVGLLKIVEKMKKGKAMEEIVRAVDGLLKGKQNKSFEEDLMVPGSTNYELGDEVGSAPNISMENLGSRESVISGVLRKNESSVTIPQQEIKKLSTDMMGMEGEIASLNGEGCDLKDEKSGECDEGMLGDVGGQDWMIGGKSKPLNSKVRGCELLLYDLPLFTDWIGGPSGSGTQLSWNVQKVSDFSSLESSEEMEREKMREKREDGKAEVRYVDSEGNFMDQREAFRYLSSQFKVLGGGKRRGKGNGKEGAGMVGYEYGCKIIGGRRLDDMAIEGNIDAEFVEEKGKEIEKGDFEVSVKGNGKGVKDLLAKQEGERMKREEWWEREREGDKMEIRRLGGVVEELRELVLRGVEMGKEKEEGEGEVCGGEKESLDEDGYKQEDKDEMHDCDKPGCCCQPSGSGSGREGGRKHGKRHECDASNVANMRARDIYGDRYEDEDGEWDPEERGVGNGNGKGFWDWVGGGILWRQD